MTEQKTYVKLCPNCAFDGIETEMDWCPVGHWLCFKCGLGDVDCEAKVKNHNDF